MLETLKTKVVTWGASAVGLGTITTLSSFLAGVSPSDALDHYGWIDAAQVTGAIPGQFYVISNENEVREPLCALVEHDFAPQEQPNNGIRIVNVLGEALPDVFRRVGKAASGRSADDAGANASYLLEWREVKLRYVPVSNLLDHNRRILAERDVEALQKTLRGDELTEAMRLESCAQAIVTSLKQGLKVCQLTEVAIDASRARPLGVEFATACLASESDSEPSRLPELRNYPLWTKVKKSLGLIEARFL
jgi:hypothetical protein